MQIELRHLTKIIGDHTIIDHIDLSLKSGRIYGLKGYNGCGKTMLMRLIAGLIRTSEGSVVIDGKQLGKDMDFPPSTGILLENPAFLGGYSGYENLRLLASIRNVITVKDVEQVLQRVGLSHAAKQKYRKYSLGMKQRLGIAAAIMEHPALIILDEPTNALDADGIELIKGLIQQERERGALILLTCHDKEILEELCDVIFTMDNGRIIHKEGDAS